MSDRVTRRHPPAATSDDIPRRPTVPPAYEKRRGTGGAGRTALLALVAWQMLAGLAAAIDIDGNRIQWGFNGKVAPNRFNILSILVENPTPQPFEGKLELQKSLGDARIVEEVNVAPFSSKWVQFYPYIGGGWNEDWVLTYGRGLRVDLPQPRFAKYQRVVLDDSSGLGPRGGVLKPLPENLFPAFSSATDALQVVGLDREPRTWIPAQKEAFLEWLHLGGTVLVLHGANGRHPEFTGPLAVLNSPLDEHRYGTGRIIKVGMTRSEFKVDEARGVLTELPKNFVAPNEKPEDPIDVVDAAPQEEVNPYADRNDPFAAGSFLSQLKDMTKPNHNWLLLHFMFWVYIAMVFPGCYLLGKKWSDFRVVYAGLLGTVTLFSFLFSVVGQRGYGEATAVHSVAIARSLPDGGLDVTAWSNVFVTGGADYAIRHNGIGALYSTCSETERVNGDINNGMEGAFVVDIPPFSNREFALRIKVPTGAPKLKVESFKPAEQGLSELVVTVDGIKPEAQSAYALFGNRFYVMGWSGNQLKLLADSGDSASMLKVQELQNWSANYGYYNQERTAQERFSLMMMPLLSRSLSVARDSEARQVRLPPGTVRIYVYSTMPPEFAIQNERLGTQDGRVLYCMDLPLAEK